MATTNQWATPNAQETIFTTGLNSVANNAGAVSSAINNLTGLYMWAMFEVYLAAQGGNRSAGAHVKFFVLPATGGTNYSYGSASLLPPSNLSPCAVQFDSGVTTARYSHSPIIMLPPFSFIVVVYNYTGQSLASSGNVIKLSRFNTYQV